MRALERFEDLLRGHGCRGSRGMWTCPAHEDRSPSLSVRAGEDGRVLVRCFAGCAVEDVVAALGLGLADLFDGPPPRGWTPPPAPPRWYQWAPAREFRGRIGLPTWDQVFWAQPDDVIDAHFARLAEMAPAPDDAAVAAWLDARHAGVLREEAGRA